MTNYDEQDYEEQMTNEKIRNRFPNQFEMVNYAIQLTRGRILEGRDLYDSENPVTVILDEINEGRDQIQSTTNKP
jgi:hypothetical protein